MNDDPVQEPASCARVRERLAELLDDDLDPLAAARDAGHLEACAACCAERDELARLLRLASELEEPPAAELALARVQLSRQLSLAAAPRRAHPLALRLVQASAAAAAAVLALAALELGARHASSWRAPSRSLPDPRPPELGAPARWADGLRHLWQDEGDPR
jgi:hypothetical protein